MGFKCQELSKYLNVSQSQKPTVSQPPRLLPDHKLVMTNQDKSATQSLDKYHLKYLLKSVLQSQNKSARKYHISLLDKYARLLTMDITDTDMDTDTESIIKLIFNLILVKTAS